MHVVKCWFNGAITRNKLRLNMIWCTAYMNAYYSYPCLLKNIWMFKPFDKDRLSNIYRIASRLAPSQWETSLLSNAVSHWLGANLESNLYLCSVITKPPLQWRHHGCDDVSNHQPHLCLLNRLFGRRSKKLRVTGLCAGNSPVTGEFPAQMASNAEYVSI